MRFIIENTAIKHFGFFFPIHLIFLLSNFHQFLLNYEFSQVLNFKPNEEINFFNQSVSVGVCVTCVWFIRIDYIWKIYFNSIYASTLTFWKVFGFLRFILSIKLLENLNLLIIIYVVNSVFEINPIVFLF